MAKKFQNIQKLDLFRIHILSDKSMQSIFLNCTSLQTLKFGPDPDERITDDAIDYVLSLVEKEPTKKTAFDTL